MSDQLDLFEDPTDSYFETRSFSTDEAELAYVGLQEDDMPSISIQLPSTVAFFIPAHGVKFGVSVLPNKFHRWIMKVLFGWKFELVAQVIPAPSKKELLLG